MECEFCNRIIENKGSLVAHQNTCINNPDRISYGRSPNAGAKRGCESWNKGKKLGRHALWNEKFSLEKVCVEDSTYPRGCLKKRIIENELISYECEICKLGPIWLGKPMPLILDHKNGVNNDNRLDNLRFVCSNCYCQLPTYKSKNKGGGGKVSKEI